MKTYWCLQSRKIPIEKRMIIAAIMPMTTATNVTIASSSSSEIGSSVVVVILTTSVIKYIIYILMSRSVGRKSLTQKYSDRPLFSMGGISEAIFI